MMMVQFAGRKFKIDVNYCFLTVTGNRANPMHKNSALQQRVNISAFEVVLLLSQVKQNICPVC